MKVSFLHFVAIGVIAVCSSCIKEKHIYKGNYLARIDTYANGLSTDTLRIFRLDAPIKAKIDNKETYITISTKDSISPFVVNGYIKKWRIPQPIGFKKDLTNDPSKLTDPYGKITKPFKYYFPEADSLSSITKFYYFDTKPVLQTLSVPIKIRPALNNEALRDSFPSQAESGLNLGLAFGWKLNHNIYKSEKNSFNENIATLSATPGVFLGSGVVELNDKNTRDPKIKFARKAALVSVGVFGMLGYNRINIGYATGYDFATGPGRNTWLYQGKRWHGIIIALDVIK